MNRGAIEAGFLGEAVERPAEFFAPEPQRFPEALIVHAVSIRTPWCVHSHDKPYAANDLKNVLRDAFCACILSVSARILCAVKHITLRQAMARARLTQQQLEDLSGVDRTWIARLRVATDANPTLDTYRKLDEALRAEGGLKRGEKLVFASEAIAS